MKPNKRLAAVAAAAMAVSGLAALSITTATSASASTHATLTCNTGSNLAGFVTNPAVGATFSLSPASVNAGQPVTVTYASAAGLDNGSPSPLAAGSAQPVAFVDVTWANAITSKVTLKVPMGTYPAASIPTGGNTGGFTMSDTVTAQGNGTANASIRTFIVMGGLRTYCGTGSNNFPTLEDSTTLADNNGYDVTGIGPWSGSGGPQYPYLNQNPNWGSSSTAVTGPNASIVSSSNQISGVTAYVRGGSGVTATISGTAWAASQASGSFTAQFCDSTGTTCDAAATNTLSTDGSGALSGTVSIAAATSTGVRALKLTNGASAAPSLTPVTVLAQAALVITPATGGVGTAVDVSGTNFNPSSYAVKFAALNQTPNFYGLPSGVNGGCTGFATPLPACIATGPYIPGPTNAVTGFTVPSNGSFSGQSVTVADAASTRVQVANKAVTAGANTNTTNDISALAGSTSAFGAVFAVVDGSCTATPSCTTSQNVKATVLAGVLSQSTAIHAGNPDKTTIQLCDTAAPTSVVNGTIAPCALPAPAAVDHMFGNLNPVTVTDTRGGSLGWSLTATMPDLSDGSHSIDNANLAIAPACASTAAGSATGVSAGAATNLGGAVTLCTKDTTADSTGGTTSGIYEVNAPLDLTVPAFQGAGNYTSTITITLS